MKFRQRLLSDIEGVRLEVEGDNRLVLNEFGEYERIPLAGNDDDNCSISSSDGEDNICDTVKEVCNDNVSNTTDQLRPIINNDNDKEIALNMPVCKTIMIDRTLVFAPGEKNKPLGIFIDKFAECKTFITLFGGKLVDVPKGLTYQSWCKF